MATKTVHPFQTLLPKYIQIQPCSSTTEQKIKRFTVLVGTSSRRWEIAKHCEVKPSACKSRCPSTWIGM